MRDGWLHYPITLIRMSTFFRGPFWSTVAPGGALSQVPRLILENLGNDRPVERAARSFDGELEQACFDRLNNQAACSAGLSLSKSTKGS